VSIPNATNPDGSWNYVVLDRELDKVKSQVFLGNNAAFLAPLLCSMEFEWTDRVQTAATDGLSIFWNPEDFLRMTPGGRISTLLHEIWHTANLTFLSAENRDMQDWNKATDYEINHNLKTDGYEIERPWFLWDDRFKGLAAEQIYEIIHQQSQCAPWGSGGSLADPNQKGQDLSQGGSGAPGGDQPAGDRNTGSDMLPAPSPEHQQKILNAVVMAANAAIIAGQPGAIPGVVQETLNKIMKPEVPWEQALYRFCEDKIQGDYSWAVRDRRYQDVYLPDLEDEERLTHLIYYFDASGSTQGPISDRIFSEISYIKKALNPEKMTIVQFDTRISKEESYSEDDTFKELVINGRGGTSLVPVRAHMMKHNPTCAVVFSDMDVAPMKPGPKCPILWISIDNRSATVPFGQLIHIKA